MSRRGNPDSFWMESGKTSLRAWLLKWVLKLKKYDVYDVDFHMVHFTCPDKLDNWVNYKDY